MNCIPAAFNSVPSALKEILEVVSGVCEIQTNNFIVKIAATFVGAQRYGAEEES
jgi:hypothetical protein